MKDRKILCPRCHLVPLRMVESDGRIYDRSDAFINPRDISFKDIFAVQFVCDYCEWSSRVYRPDEPTHDRPFSSKQYEDDVYDHISLLHDLPAYREYREKKKASWNKFLAELAGGAGYACCGI